ncbi:MAG: ammonia-forming cytochrome c nitrite reductase subunit c552 [Elusimicrobia bacterium]|nr:ammonia-forming cytochrome c nitrite reductase subunit c552 [Elusimicrobiota bacterium]MBK7545993.1 ammonia-forming cytochrome c nitrite reductase subunit c552 [Elusimicrobiota bacterium]MBK7574869.1 ammonia-forming cytochrome c nitrite reductase subunit c552 [Elusimicrobiota bacterium]MBK8125603.1 ammonia-forming cytochrome c nitrite reductase subunit c552 [Elusimicrobiota bacterium]MBK8423110.1 ammonia-forming cytochrome c nitrite reductase subunit c552 [Elusimicrobiota bacterium]
MTLSPDLLKSKKAVALVALGLVVATAGATALLVNIFERKGEARRPYVRLVEVTEDTTDPAQWGVNWPKEYDTYKLTALSTRTRFGGHGGSEAMPQDKLDRDPWLKRMFAGYAFAIDYRDRRGHAYMLSDQEKTERLTKPQSGSCLHCHASVMPLYRKLGDGDVLKGFEASHKLSYQEANKQLHDLGHAHPVSCVDCHDPKSMKLRVTRPGFMLGIQAFAASNAPAPHLPSIERWRAGDRRTPYDPNTLAVQTEMRSFVCGQCHVEYYCGTKAPLTFPWGKGLRAENLEDFWGTSKFPDGEPFFDYKHAETGAPVFKAQHPEFELWSQGVHARSGVSCADCHMPYMRDGATKVSDHWVRSPLLNINRACQTCHRIPEKEIRERVDLIQGRNHALLQRAAQALMDQLDAMVEAKKDGVPEAQLTAARDFQRKAQWRLDFISSENSMGFHAPQEAARVLGEAIDYARQGEIAARRARRKS